MIRPIPTGQCPETLSPIGDILRDWDRPAKLNKVLEKLSRSDSQGEQLSARDYERVAERMFENLVDRLMPQHANRIQEAGNPWQQITMFADIFSQEHFPLNEGWLQMVAEHYTEMDEEEEETENGHEFILRGIPVQIMGVEDEELHDIWNYNHRRGTAMAALLVRFQAFNEYHQREIEGMRQQWLESAAMESIREKTLARIPPGGIPLEDIQEAVRGTPLEGLARACEWLTHNTGNPFLDESIDEEMELEYRDAWTPENIQEIQGCWNQARAMMDQEQPVMEWLERNPARNFDKLLDFIMGRIPVRTAPQGEGETGENQGEEQA